MASTNRGHRRTFDTYEGLEVDPSTAALHALPESLGIEATTGEFQLTTAPQTKESPEKESARVLARIAQSQPASLFDVKTLSGSRSFKDSKRIPLVLTFTTIIIMVVLALGIPLALKLRKPSKLYATTLSNHEYS